MTHDQLTQEALDLFDTFKHPTPITKRELLRIVMEYLNLQGYSVEQRHSIQNMKRLENLKL